MDEGYERLRQALSNREAIRLAYLFGSAARGDTHAGSDVDVAVLARPPLDGVEAEGLRLSLAEAVGRRVDLVDLDRAPPLLLREVIGGGQLLICRSASEQAEFELQAIARFLDTRHLRAVQRAYLQQRLEERRGRQP